MTRRARTLSVAAAAIALLLGACSDDEPASPTDRLLRAYDGLAAGSLHVETGQDDAGADYVETIVQLDSDTSAAEIVEVIVGHPDKVEGAGFSEALENQRLRFLTDAGPTVTLRWTGDPDEEGLLTGIEHFFVVSELVGPQVQLVLGSDGAELYGVHGDSVGSVSEDFRTLAADPAIASAYAVWDVNAAAGGTELRFAINGLPTDEQLGAWEALVSSLGKLPVDHAAARLDVAVASNARVQVGLTAPPGTALLTPLPDGELLWPALHAQLDAVPGLLDEWEYVVNWATTDQPTSAQPLISLQSDKRPRDNADPASAWSRAAYDYVNKRGE